MIVTQNKILTTIHIFSKLLQSEKQDLSKVCALLKEAYEDLKLYRNDFKSVVQTATHTAKCWGIKPEFLKKIISKRVKHFDEVENDSRLNESGKSFEMNVFNTSLQTILMQLKERFLGLQSVATLFICLLPHQMPSYIDDELFYAATNLANAYPDDLTKDLSPQTISIRSSFKTKIKQFNNVYDLAFMLQPPTSLTLLSPTNCGRLGANVCYKTGSS
jgi:hypothetical protein